MVLYQADTYIVLPQGKHFHIGKRSAAKPSVDHNLRVEVMSILPVSYMHVLITHRACIICTHQKEYVHSQQ